MKLDYEIMTENKIFLVKGQENKVHSIINCDIVELTPELEEKIKKDIMIGYNEWENDRYTKTLITKVFQKLKEELK